jgi:lysophospholipase L1-like esterase
MKLKITKFFNCSFFHSKKKRILVFGDSNSSIPNKKSCWPSVMQKMLGNGYRVINESINGRTIMYDSGNRNGYLVLKKKLKNHTPLDVIVIMLGTNDIKTCYGPPDIEEIMNNFRLMLDFIHSTCEKVKLILILPPPIGIKESDDFCDATYRIVQLSSAISSLARERGILTIDMHSILNLKTDMENDLIHLNRHGREKVANSVCKHF